MDAIVRDPGNAFASRERDESRNDDKGAGFATRILRHMDKCILREFF
jgi:hypothetical protein